MKNWLLLRGLGRNKKHWLGFPDQLRSSGLNILEIDLPGFGTESKIDAPMTIRENANFTRERFLQTKNSGEPWGIIALSLGAMVAMDWASQHENDIQKLILINTSAGGVCMPWERMRPTALTKLGQAIVTSDLSKRESIALSLISNLHTHDKQIHDTLLNISKEFPIDVKKFGKQIYAATKFFAPKKIKAPIIFIASENDRLVNSSCSKKLAAYYKAPVILHPTAGHDLPIDDSTWLTTEILKTC